MSNYVVLLWIWVIPSYMLLKDNKVLLRKLKAEKKTGYYLLCGLYLSPLSFVVLVIETGFVFLKVNYKMILRIRRRPIK